jgi:urease accessory protein
VTDAHPGAARVGIGGPVGSGKTALIEQIVPRVIKRGIEVGVITNDLVTQEDAQRLKRSGLIDPDRVIAVETGACPHTAIREDPSLNIHEANVLEDTFENLDLILIESGGDNLASTFSLDLVDYWLFVIDVAGGDDIPRKRGPGVVLSDIHVINKTDLAPYVGADVDLMVREANAVRGEKPVYLTNCRSGEGVDAVLEQVLHDALVARLPR